MSAAGQGVLGPWPDGVPREAEDEFAAIARLFAPLTGGAEAAAGLLDDAAFLPARPGFDLVVTKDAMVEGVHCLADDPADLIARKLLRVNLSDLAAKAAEPFGYLLAVAWPARWSAAAREGFARGLGRDQTAYGVRLLGGDTVATPGPMVASVTALGHAPAGRAVRRAGARAGDAVLVTGTIGDGRLGLDAARGRLAELGAASVAYLADRYRLPQPRVPLRETLLTYAHACADVSDGLAADVGHLAAASGVRAELDLGRLPLSDAAHAWVDRQPDPAVALGLLATGGDDYELALAVAPEAADAAIAHAAAAGVSLARVGAITAGAGVRLSFKGREVAPDRPGYVHA